MWRKWVLVGNETFLLELRVELCLGYEWNGGGIENFEHLPISYIKFHCIPSNFFIPAKYNIKPHQFWVGPCLVVISSVLVSLELLSVPRCNGKNACYCSCYVCLGTETEMPTFSRKIPLVRWLHFWKLTTLAACSDCKF